MRSYGPICGACRWDQRPKAFLHQSVSKTASPISLPFPFRKLRVSGSVQLWCVSLPVLASTTTAIGQNCSYQGDKDGAFGVNHGRLGDDITLLEIFRRSL